MPLTWHSYELVSLLWFVIRPPSTSQITCTAVIEKQHPHQWWRHSSHILQIPFPPSFSYSLWQHLTVSKAQVLATQFPFPLNISVQEQLCFIKTCGLVLKSLRNITGISSAESHLQASSNLLERLLAHRTFLDVLDSRSRGNPLAFTLSGSSLLPC